MVTIGMNVAMNGYDFTITKTPAFTGCWSLRGGGGGGVGGRGRENHHSIDCLNPFGGNKMLFLKIAPQC